MASQILMFPTDSASARRSRPHAAASALALEDDFPEAAGQHGLQLVYSRPCGTSDNRNPDTRTQAQRIAAQVERELAGRVQREAAERHREIRHEYRMPSGTDRRAFASSMPHQATEIGLRHRLLDALLFFARPA